MIHGDKHIENLYSQANFKLHTMHGTRKYLRTEKTGVVRNVFINSQLNYSQIIWMFSNKIDYHYQVEPRVYANVIRTQTNRLLSGVGLLEYVWTEGIVSKYCIKSCSKSN